VQQCTNFNYGSEKEIGLKLLPNWTTVVFGVLMRYVIKFPAKIMFWRLNAAVV